MKHWSIGCKAEAFLRPFKKWYQIKGGLAQARLNKLHPDVHHRPDPSWLRLTGRPSLISVLFRAGSQKSGFSDKCHITMSFLCRCAKHSSFYNKLFSLLCNASGWSCQSTPGKGWKNRQKIKNKIGT